MDASSGLKLDMPDFNFALRLTRPKCPKAEDGHDQRENPRPKKAKATQ